MNERQTTEAAFAPCYDQRKIRAWDGFMGVTGAYERGGNLLIVSQDKFWRWNPNNRARTKRSSIFWWRLVFFEPIGTASMSVTGKD
jgi:hypothetical protein